MGLFIFLFVVLCFTGLQNNCILFMQTNLQLLAGCYLQNSQAYSAYHILKGSMLHVFIFQMVVNL
jgi:hypothetical protein